jgi:hypothetical protein
MKCPENQASEDGLYDLAEDGRAPVKPKPTPVDTTVPPAPTLAYQTPKRADPRTQDRGVDPDLLKKYYAPLWLLGGGLVIEFVSEYFRHAGNLQGAMIDISVGLFAGTILMLVGVMIAAKLRHIDIGSFGSAALRLAAISVAPGALVTLLEPLAHVICFGWVLLLGIEFVLYFALIGALFDLDESDTWYFVITIFILNLGVFAVLQWIANR